MLNTVSESSITNDGILAMKFASARAREIFSLEQILKKKTRRSCSTKDLSVLWEKNNNPLPRHMRRRTTSHKRRKSAKRYSGQKKSPYSESDSTNVGSTERLETHRWHSKRFFMQKKWGFEMPIKRNDIGSEAVTKAFLKRCAIHDASYYSIYEVKDTPYENIATFLATMFPALKSDPSKATYTAQAVHQMCRSSSFSPTQLMYTYDNFPDKLIGPIDIMYHLNGIWLLVHPTISRAVEKNVHAYNENNGRKINIDMRKISSNFSIFHFYGSQAVLKDLFNENGEVACKALKGDTQRDERKYVSIHVQDPRYRGLGKASSVAKTLFDIEGYKEIIKSYLPDNVINASTGEKSRTIPNIPCINIFKNDLVTTASSRKKCIHPLGTASWIFIIPKIYSKVLWNKFTTCNLVPVAIDGVFRIYNECNKAYFPNDYPGTEAGVCAIIERCKNEELQQLKKPKRHRINFSRLRQNTTAFPQWNVYASTSHPNLLCHERNNTKLSVTNIVQSSEISVMRGAAHKFVPSKVLAINDSGVNKQTKVYHPKSIQQQKQAILSLLTQFSSSNISLLPFVKLHIRSCRRGVPTFGSIVSLPTHPISAPLGQMHGMEEKRGLEGDLEPKFRQIGYVTSGCRNISLGQNIGICFCCLRSIEHYINMGGEILLFRNRGSRVYRCAYFSILTVT